MNGKRYPSDLTDAQWAKLEPLLPPAKKGGRPRTANMREVCNAIFYVLRTGCQWNSLPKDLPAYSTTYYYFRRWQKYGVWEQINAALRAKIRVGLQRNVQPSAAVIDSQSVKTTEKRGMYMDLMAVKKSRDANGTS
jgi:putative transposase